MIKFQSRKISENGSLNENAISLDSLKKCSIGDEIVVLTKDNTVQWLRVTDRVGLRGIYGKTTITLCDIVTSFQVSFELKNELPDCFIKVRRVSSGVNARTTKQIDVPTKKLTLLQPEGDFENILDVPLIEEESVVIGNS